MPRDSPDAVEVMSPQLVKRFWTKTQTGVVPSLTRSILRERRYTKVISLIIQFSARGHDIVVRCAPPQIHRDQCYLAGNVAYARKVVNLQTDRACERPGTSGIDCRRESGYSLQHSGLQACTCATNQKRNFIFSSSTPIYEEH